MNFGKREDSVSIAWYKLADLIARGEREKALNVYRLLSHSLDDKAYALQLEGDLLWSLADGERAREKYRQAAVLYKKEQRWVDAIAVCHHFLEITPHDLQLMSVLLCCYAVIDWQERFEKYAVIFFDHLRQGEEHEKILTELVEHLQFFISTSEATGQWLIPILRTLTSQQPAWVKQPMQPLFS